MILSNTGGWTATLGDRKITDQISQLFPTVNGNGATIDTDSKQGRDGRRGWATVFSLYKKTVLTVQEMCAKVHGLNTVAGIKIRRDCSRSCYRFHRLWLAFCSLMVDHLQLAGS